MKGRCLSAKDLSPARRTENFQESVIREMTRVALAEDAINLSQGLPDFSPCDEIVKAAHDAIAGDNHQYSITHGMMELREALAEKLARRNALSFDPAEEITITCGVSEGVMSSVLALVDPGDEVMVFEPFYENYLPAIELAGATPVFVTLPFGDWGLDAGALSRAFTPRTKAVILNTPMNPTGKVFSPEELALIADLCRRHNCVAITDEIYEDIIYDGVTHTSLASLPGMRDRTITVGGFSKTYAVTGWRVGYVAATKELSCAVRKVHDYLTICGPTPLQKACVAALALPASYYDRVREAYRIRRDLFCSGLREIGFNVAWPCGAYYVLVDFSALSSHDDGVFAHELAHDGGVASVPGSSFYHDGDAGRRIVRFSFAMREGTLNEALGRIRRRTTPAGGE